MSGICAVVRYDGELVAQPVLAAAAAALGGTSAPEVRSWMGEPPEVGLACARLLTTPEDQREHQPLISNDGNLTLVADARLDNREDLAHALRLPAPTADVPDAALILAAYATWGEHAASRLLGDFAIIVWDARRRRLWCARDHLGQRTLAYRRTARSFAIASSPRIVPRLDGGPVALDLEKAGEFLLRLEDPDRTFWVDVRHLPAGHTLVADARGVRLRPYWRIEDVPAIRLRSDPEYVEAFLSVWRAAVACRLRATGGIGVMLSGGLDSSAVASMAAALLSNRGERLFAYHAAPRENFVGVMRRGWVAEETDDVRSIAALHENIVLDIVRPDQRTFLDDAEALFESACVPLANADNRHWFEGILARAHGRGVTVMLGGYKGNATISYTGVRGLRRWAYTGQWRRLLREASALAEVRGRRTRAIVREAMAPPVPAGLHALIRSARGRPMPPLLDAFPSPIHPELVRELRLEERMRDAGLDPRIPDWSLGRSFRMRMMKRAGDAADLYRGLRALYGVEPRDPTSDLRVVEFCLGIPDEQYLRGGRERQLVRRALVGLVPERVLERTTRGAQAPDWFERLSALRPRMLGEIERMEASTTARRCVDVARLRAILERWPESAGLDHEPDGRYRLTAGLSMGMFLCWFEGQSSEATT